MAQGAKVLVVDDESNFTQVISAVLRRDGHEVIACDDGEAAVAALAAEQPDIVVTDVIMRKVSGIELLRHMQKEQPAIPVIMMTAFGTIKTAVDAIKLGAYDYLAKPFDMEELRSVVRGAMEERKARRSNLQAPMDAAADLPESGTLPGMVGKGAWLKEVSHLAVKVAKSRANVLIRGESGTGKELVARAIHAHSNRRQAPFVAVACAALSSDLLESELFGHEKGAFTGAVAQKPGRFELADGGTLFLDEIGDITVNLQLKLLRVLQEREFERVGGTKTLKVDVRLIAATNRDLEAAVQAGGFREDLYYRLQVVQITLPPLRERQEDVPDLVHHFLGKFNKQNGRTATRVARKVMDLLKAYPWPGNVRELENAIERAVVLSDSASEGLEAELLPSAVTQYREGAVVGHSPGKKGRNGARPHLVSATLRRCGGDPAKAAAVLGMPVRSVRYYAEKYGLGHTEPVRNEKRKRRA